MTPADDNTLQTPEQLEQRLAGIGHAMRLLGSGMSVEATREQLVRDLKLDPKLASECVDGCLVMAGSADPNKLQDQKASSPLQAGMVGAILGGLIGGIGRLIYLAKHDSDASGVMQSAVAGALIGGVLVSFIKYRLSRLNA